MGRLPEIRIKDGFLLRENASKYLHELWGKNEDLASDDDMQKIVESYRLEWQKYEAKILQYVVDTLGVEFYKDVIDVYIAPWFHAFSDPLVIGVIHTPDEFVDQLTHELLHVILTDNECKSIDSKGSQVGDEWRDLFGNTHSFTTLIHIPVHALQESIYLNVFKDSKRKGRELKALRTNKAKDYLYAWDYVQTEGYQEIIRKLKTTYTKTYREYK